jgi:hypothetical protein
MATALILKHANASRSFSQWRDNDYDVLENGVVVGRIFFLDAAGPQGRPWMWASGHSAGTVARAAHGYEPTREAAMKVSRSLGKPLERRLRNYPRRRDRRARAKPRRRDGASQG